MSQMGLNPDKFKSTGQESWLSQFDRADFRTTGAPGSGGIMTAASLALFYQGVMGYRRTVKGETLPQTKDVTTRASSSKRRALTDPMTGQKAGRSLGLVVAGDESKVFRSFAPTHSEGAFGHPGAGGQIGWADPKNGAFICTSHQRARAQSTSAGYACHVFF